MEVGKILLLCILSAVAYGILHDQVTARVCVEYFTIGHPPVFPTDSPTLLGLGWGIIATWWVGLMLGLPLACVSRLGVWPKLTVAGLFRPIGVLLGAVGCVSLMAGFTGFFMARSGMVWLVEPLRSLVPESKHAFFIADLWAHLAAYGVGSLGGLILCGWILSTRRKTASPSAQGCDP